MDTCKRRHFLQEIAAAETLAAAEGETQTNGSTAQTGMTGLLGASAGGTGAERYSRGIEVLKRIGGAGYDIPLHRLAQVAPDLARFTVEFAYGDILSRPGLDLRLRQIATVAALMAHGSVQPQLKYHMTGFLNAEGEAQGRRVGVEVDRSGAVLVGEDVGNAVWRVTTDTRLK